MFHFEKYKGNVLQSVNEPHQTTKPNKQCFCKTTVIEQVHNIKKTIVNCQTSLLRKVFIVFYTQTNVHKCNFFGVVARERIACTKTLII